MGSEIENSAALTLCQLISTVIDPSSTNQNRLQANQQLDNILQNEVSQDTKRYLQVAYLLISKSKSCDQTMDYQLRGFIGYYGFRLVQLSLQCPPNAEMRSELKQKCIEWSHDPWLNGASNLVVNECSKCIVQVFFKLWQNRYWISFFDDIFSENCTSLVSLSVLLNISDSLHVQQLPANTSFRKEIISHLIKMSSRYNAYLINCFKLIESPSDSIANETKERLFSKLTQAIDSLFVWFTIETQLVEHVLRLATSPLNSFPSVIRINLFEDIQTLIGRCQHLSEDYADTGELLFKFGPNKFIHFLTDQFVPNYLSNCSSQIMSDPNEFKLFTMVLSVHVDLICHSLHLYNLSASHISLRTSYIENQQIWRGFLATTVRILDMNIEMFDDILLKFLLALIKLAQPPAHDRLLLEQNWEKVTSYSPIDADVEQEFFTRFLTLFTRKLLPKSETEMDQSDLYSIATQFEDYDSYVAYFMSVKAKFVNCLNSFIMVQPEMCEKFILKILTDKFFTQPSEFHNLKWSVVAPLCSLIISKFGNQVR